MFACAKRTGAAARESLRQDRPVGLMSRQSFSLSQKPKHSSFNNLNTHSVLGRFQRIPSPRVCFLHMRACVCMRSKAWLAAPVSLRLARLPRTASSAQRSRRLCSSRALLVHAIRRKHMVLAVTHTLLLLISTPTHLHILPPGT